VRGGAGTKRPMGDRVRMVAESFFLIVLCSSAFSAAPVLDWREAGRDAGGSGLGLGLKDRILQRSGSALFSAARRGFLLAGAARRRHQGNGGYLSDLEPL